MKSIAKSKIVHHCSQLSKRELKRFLLFARSPYFNQSEALVALIEYISECHPKLSKRDLESELVLEKIELKTKTKITSLDFLLSKAFTLFQNYLYIEKTQNDLAYQNSHDFEFTLEYYPEKREKLLSKLTGSDPFSISPDEQLTHFQIHQLNLSYLNNNKNRNDLSERETSLGQSKVSLNNFYLYNHAIQLAMEAQYDRIKGSEPNHKEINQTIQLLADPENLSLRVALCLLKMTYDYRDHGAYEMSKELLQDHNDVLSFNHKRDLHVVMHYCLANRMNQGEVLFGEINLHLNMMLEEKTILVNGLLHPTVLQNLVNNALYLKEPENALKFVEKYGKYVSHKLREETVCLCKADIYIALEQYDQALETLGKPTFHLTDFKFFAAIIEILVHMHRANHEVLSAKVKNLYEWTRSNKKFDRSHKARYLRTVEIAKNIVKLFDESQVNKSDLADKKSKLVKKIRAKGKDEICASPHFLERMVSLI